MRLALILALLGSGLWAQDESPTKFELTIKTLTGKSIALTVASTAAVRDIKAAVQQKEDIPVEQQRLIFAGRQLEDDQPIQSYKIMNGSTLHLVLRLRGPSAPPSAVAVKAADVKWVDAKDMPPGVKSCLIHGDPASGAFVLLMKAPAGTVWKPHVHTSDEVVFIQSGEFMISASDKIDESKALTLDAGGYFSLKAKTAHWAKAKSEVVFLRYGNGPADITYLDGGK
jgi:quercetin dioxygenase-like cupin family protein